MKLEQKNTLTIINRKGRSNFVMQGVLNKASQTAIPVASTCMPAGGNPTKASANFKSVTLAIAALAEVVGKKQKRKFNPTTTNSQLLLIAFALHIPARPSVIPSLSVVSQGQLEANKHFLGRVEDKQTIKC